MGKAKLKSSPCKRCFNFIVSTLWAERNHKYYFLIKVYVICDLKKVIYTCELKKISKQQSNKIFEKSLWKSCFHFSVVLLVEVLGIRLENICYSFRTNADTSLQNISFLFEISSVLYWKSPSLQVLCKDFFRKVMCVAFFLELPTRKFF